MVREILFLNLFIFLAFISALTVLPNNYTCKKDPQAALKEVDRMKKDKAYFYYELLN